MPYNRKAKVPFYKRVGRFARKVVKKRYGTFNKPKITNIAKDVAMLKHLVNVEKKKTDITLSTKTGVAQFADVALATTGCYAVRITPTIYQGIGSAQRTGNSLKIVSSMINIQFTAQEHCRNNTRLRWYIINVPEEDMGLTDLKQKFFDENPFSGVIDYNSARNPDNFTQFKIIKSGTSYIKMEQYPANHSSTRYSANVKCPLRLNHHLKYASNTTAITQKNQFYILVVADNGDTSASTGVDIQFNTRWYYTDN